MGTFAGMGKTGQGIDRRPALEVETAATPQSFELQRAWNSLTNLS
jgi:hypothetical protein